MKYTLNLCLITAICLAAYIPNAKSQEIPIQHAFIDNSDLGADCKSVGDVDGDGLPDVIIADNSGTFLQWYRAPNWTKYIIEPRSVFTTDMQAGSVLGNGIIDVIVPDYPAQEILWYENPRNSGGDPFTGQWVKHVIGSADAHDVEIGDVNADGKLDVVVRGHGGATILFLQVNPTSWTRVVMTTASGGEGTALGNVAGHSDGKLDIVGNGYWLEQPADPVNGTWTKHTISNAWPSLVSATVADMNQDGRQDILLAASESTGQLAWYEAPVDRINGTWIEHIVDNSVDYVHRFRVADFNLDGKPDIAFAEMQQSSRKRVGVYVNGGNSLSWTLQVLSTTGSHNICSADIGSDGDMDIVGSNYSNYSPVELWENQIRGPQQGLDSWTYIQVDNARTSPPAFGLTFLSLQQDGYKDIASGQFFYRNPRGDLSGTWSRVQLPNNVDAMLTVDADGDGREDIIATALPNVYWLRSSDNLGSSWTATQIATLPATSHGNGQGYKMAQIIPGGKPEIVLAAGPGRGAIYYIEIPSNPSAGTWPVTQITATSTDEGVGVGDIDNDGYLDVAGAYGDNGLNVAWWKNPGNGTGNWTRYEIGTTVNFKDRTEIADINGDGRLDVIVTEETGSASGASTYWYEAPANPMTGTWIRHTLVTQATTNSLDVADMNGDGQMDIITGEHRGTMKLTIWQNVNHGASFIPHIVDSGKESHLGARTVDLNNDGRKDIVSICYDSYQLLHVWRNDAIVASIPLSSSGPQGFVLFQNYPNPFNPTTEISYQIPQEQFVTLKLYDVAGREVRALVNEILPAGRYTLTVDARALASGIYFYRIDAGNFSQTKKFVLIR
ncbi:MAG: T9SS type A sorting domain-containing protein [bacterium]